MLLYFFVVIISTEGFSGSAVVKNLPIIARDMRLILGSEKIPWSGKWQSTPVFLPAKFHGHRSLVGYSP